jgi:site-specific recombinase XerD
MSQVYAKSFRLRSGAHCWGLIEEVVPGERHRLDPPSDFLVAEAARNVSPNTVTRRATSLQQWWQWAVDTGLSPLAPDSKDLSSFVLALQSTPKRGPLSSPLLLLPGDGRRRSSSTVRYRVDDLRAFFSWAKGAGRVSDGVASQVESFRPPRVTDARTVTRLSVGQVKTLTDAKLVPRDRLAVELVYSGLRKGEALGLQVDDWHPDSATAQAFGCTVMWPHFHVVRRMTQMGRIGKSRYPRLVPIWPRLSQAMRVNNAWLFENLQASLSCKFVLVSTSGPSSGRGWTRSGLDSMWDAKVRTLPGMAGVTRHQLRHTFASELVEAGVAREVVMGWLGHRHPETTHRYAHPSAELMAESVNRRSQHLAEIGVSA